MSVIRSLKRKREPESKDENEACKVLVHEGPKEPGRFLFGKYTNTEDDTERVAAAPARLRRLSAASQANREAWVEVIIARCEVASLNDGCRWRWCGDPIGPFHHEYYCSYNAAPDRKELNDGCRWSFNGFGAQSDPLNTFRGHRFFCEADRDCPVKKEVQRCLDDPSILITRYEGTHNHPLPVGAITAMASTALSDGTSATSVTQAYRPYHACYLINKSSHPPNIRSINPDDPSKGIVVDLTSNSDDPPQFPVRDEDQNQAPKILVGEDSKKDGTVFAALTYQKEIVRCMHMYLFVMAQLARELV